MRFSTLLTRDIEKTGNQIRLRQAERSVSEAGCSAPAPSNPAKPPSSTATSATTPGPPTSALDSPPQPLNPPIEIPPVPPPPPQLPASAAPTGTGPATYGNPAQGECRPHPASLPPSLHPVSPHLDLHPPAWRPTRVRPLASHPPPPPPDIQWCCLTPAPITPAVECFRLL
ncbi:hypothetical protein INR49_001283 [Caranx melampygus]|nr:hypothetical protein INR49_001283 [Caranx melampygus]